MGRKYKPRVKERVFELYQDEKVLNPSAIEIMGNDKTLAESYGLTLLYMSYKKITCQEVLYHHKSGATVLIEGDDLTEQSPRTAIFIYSVKPETAVNEVRGFVKDLGFKMKKL